VRILDIKSPYDTILKDLKLQGVLGVSFSDKDLREMLTQEKVIGSTAKLRSFPDDNWLHLDFTGAWCTLASKLLS
jgi:hypothetical protein